MQDISYFFNPIELDETIFPYPSKFDTMRYMVAKYEEEFPDWTKADIVLMGCTEERGGFGKPGCGDAPDVIRSFFYNLSAPEKEMKIVDLGNLVPKEDIDELYFALAFVTEVLLRNNKIVVLLGGTQDLTYAQYAAFEKMETSIEYVCIDHSPDIFDSDAGLTSASYNHMILTHHPDYLSHYTVLGAQNYFITREERTALKSLNFEAVRVGEIHSNLRIAELYLRQASLVSFDLSAIRQSEAPGASHPTPGGLTLEEACQIARFAGMGYQTQCINFTEINPHIDLNFQTSHVAALLVWFFMDGCYSRPNDRPRADRSNLLRYRVGMQGAIKELIFYKHEITERWWMEVPSPDTVGKEKGHSILVPCSELDYQLSLKDEIPERWWVMYGKF